MKFQAWPTVVWDVTCFSASHSCWCFCSSSWKTGCAVPACLKSFVPKLGKEVNIVFYLKKKTSSPCREQYCWTSCKTSAEPSFQENPCQDAPWFQQRRAREVLSWLLLAVPSIKHLEPKQPDSLTVQGCSHPGVPRILQVFPAGAEFSNLACQRSATVGTLFQGRVGRPDDHSKSLRWNQRPAVNPWLAGFVFYNKCNAIPLLYFLYKCKYP